MRKRHINNPKRRIHKSGQLDVELRAKLLRGARYLGSAHH